MDAPVLLTPTGRLHRGVANFIEDYGVSTVYVLGGPAAVTESVVTALEGLVNRPAVTRIGADPTGTRYTTAAAISSMIDRETSWCGTRAASAVLINGATDALPFGVAVSTTAYRLQLPVLMTAVDELPVATVDFIDENDIEHVQIIGGTGTVSAEVESALTSLGVDTVDRIDGDSASAVSVELAELANPGGACATDLAPVSTQRVVLVRGNPDGVAAAPVLASSLDSGAMVTPLIVGDSLPASVREYLAATPTTVGSVKLDLGIVAVGGTAAVSDSVMEAATLAAASTGELTVQIGAATDTNGDGVVNADDPVRPQGVVVTAGSETPVIRLYFSDDVTPFDALGSPVTQTTAQQRLYGNLRDVIEVNGVPAVIQGAETVTSGGCNPRLIDVALGLPLSHGDVISVEPSAFEFGIQADKRTIAERATETVQAPPPDTTGPVVTIAGITVAAVEDTARTAATASSPSGSPHGSFQIRLADPSRIGDAAVTGSDQIAPSEVTVTAAPGSTAITAYSVNHTAGATTATVSVTRAAVAGVHPADVVRPGDVITLKARAVADGKGNFNAQTSQTAIAEPASPFVSSVWMSRLIHNLQNTWTVPSGEFGTVLQSGVTNTALTISAKASGDAAGAAGNDWDIVFDVASSYDPAKAPAIDVRVDATGKVVTARVLNGRVTVGHLLDALRANEDFDERFTAIIPCANVGTGRRTPLGVNSAAVNRNVDLVSAAAGRTRFAVEVRFNSFVHSHDDTVLLDAVFAGAAGRTNSALGVRTITGSALAGSSRPAAVTTMAMQTVGAVTNGVAALTPGVTGTHGEYSNRVRFQIQVSSVLDIPKTDGVRDIVAVKAGHAGDGVSSRTVLPDINGNALAAIPVQAAAALSYAEDKDHDPANKRDAVDEQMNGASDRRIEMQPARVAAPPSR